MLTNPGPWRLAVTGCTALVVGVACSATSPRDQNFGSNIGRNDASGQVALDGGMDGATVDVVVLPPALDATLDDTVDAATETMDDDDANAQDIVDPDAVGGGNL